jgi:hypothetical protein
MNLYLSVGTAEPTFALEVTVTETGLTYKTYPAFSIEELKKTWRQQLENSSFAPMHTPTPDEKPLWTTEKFAVYNHVNVTINDPVAGIVVVSHQEENSIDFASIKELPDYSDHAIYQIYTPDSPLNIVEKASLPLAYSRQVSNRLAVAVIHNSVAHTATSKINPFAWSNLGKNNPMIAIIVPLADMPTSEWDIMLSVADEGLIKINSAVAATPLTVAKGMIPHVHMPKVAFKGKTATVDADGYVDVEFSLVTAQGAPLETEHNATVYLKTTAGVLNKQQVKTVGGKGTVRLIANHLEAGDVATVSCGFQYWSGTDDCVITVK